MLGELFSASLGAESPLDSTLWGPSAELRADEPHELRARQRSAVIRFAKPSSSVSRFTFFASSR